MPQPDRLHSRVVAWLRLGLPLAALAALSTLFLFSRDIDPARALLYADVDAEDLARDPRIGAPRFSGVTDDGTAVTLVAATVRIASGDGESAVGEEVTAAFEAPDGSVSTAAADRAVIDREAGTLRLIGQVRLTGATGYVVDSEELVARLDRTRVESPGPVVAEGPAGQIEAGAMVLRLRADETEAPAAHELVFTGGVRLLYRPDVATPETESP